jgi:hypothetical protein
MEYTPTFRSSVGLAPVSVSNLPTTTWTLLKVTSKALKAGERMLPVLYSTNETTRTGSLVFDDCSVHAG